jgi:hypothetical protein
MLMALARRDPTTHVREGELGSDLKSTRRNSAGFGNGVVARIKREIEVAA